MTPKDIDFKTTNPAETAPQIDHRTDQALHHALSVNRPVAVLAYDYPANDAVPMHEHPRAQLLYAIAGTMIVSTRNGRWILLPTRAVWIPAHTRHAIRMRGPVQMRTVFFDATVTLPTPASSAGPAVLHVSPLLRELIVGMLHEPQDYAPESRGAHLAALITSELRRAPALPLHLPWPTDPRLRSLCAAIQARPGLHRDMSFWATRANMSTRTLARLFRSGLGMSFHEWRSQLLLLEAQMRLAQGHSSSRIARALGYSSPAAFTAMFRKATGHAPTEERKLLDSPARP